MAYTVGYAINDSANGDTVQEAFSKYKAEAVRIYGYLNELSGKDLTAAELNALKTGSIDGSRVTGTVAGYIDGTHVTGNIAAWKVSGTLTNATIPSGNVTGLTAFVNGLITAGQSDSGDGIVDASVGSNGYAKFANGLIVQWGASSEASTVHYQSFPISFPNACFLVVGSRLKADSSATLVPVSDDSTSAYKFFISSWSTSGFSYETNSSAAKISYIAIGK